MFNTLIVNPLINALLALYALIPGHDMGVAVIVLTVLVRLLLWPLASKQLHSQRAMQKLAPEIAKIRKQVGKDKQKESQMLMELYKEKGISPFASLTPVLIQMPLLIAFYYALRHAVHAADIARLAYEPVRHLAAVADIIAKPATYAPSLLGLIALSKPNVVVAVLAGLAQFYQSKQILPAKQTGTKDPTAQAAQMTLLVFPFLTFLLALSLPSALGIYWAVASGVAILQQTLILRKDAREMEAV